MLCRHGSKIVLIFVAIKNKLALSEVTMRKIAFVLSLMLLIHTNAWAEENKNSAWEGVWEYGRYVENLFGSLKITDCKGDFCHFNIVTANGAHTCNLEGKLKIDADKGEYKIRVDNFEGKYDDIIVTFNLDTNKNIIEVDANYVSRRYCGMQGYFTGEYENENNPLRYDTGFDCWAKNLTDIEQTVCASKKLARASKEMTEKYPSLQTKEWYNKRSDCSTDKKCLWNFYISSIKSGYEKEQGKSLNLYEYMGNLSEDALYYPTDFSLLTDYLARNMEKKDYDEWVSNFSQISMEDNKCDKCYYRQYGVAGLYTIMESAFYIDKDEIWLAFLHRDYKHPQEEYIVIYTLPDKEKKTFPSCLIIG